MTDPMQAVSHGVKFLLTSIGCSFLLGAVFWAGATYNRIDAMERHLMSIDSAVAKIGELQTTVIRVEEHDKRLDRLENSVKQLR